MEKRDVLAELRARFLERSRGELEVLRRHRSANEPLGTTATHQTLLATAHGLAGAGGTFGYPEVSNRASALETVLLEPNAPEKERQEALENLVEALEALVGRPS